MGAISPYEKGSEHLLETTKCKVAPRAVEIVGQEVSLFVAFILDFLHRTTLDTQGLDRGWHALAGYAVLVSSCRGRWIRRKGVWKIGSRIAGIGVGPTGFFYEATTGPRPWLISNRYY
jgi:hypothetical protein